MTAANASELEQYREYLGLLGRSQLDDRLAGKVDVSGVIQVTWLEAVAAGWSELDRDERLPWLKRIFANNLLDEVRKFRTQARDARRELSLDDQHFQSLLVACLESLQRGETIDREALARDFPEYAVEVQPFLDDRQFLEQVAADFVNVEPSRVPTEKKQAAKES